MSFLSYITVLMGLVSLTLSASLSLYFIRSGSRIGKAVSYMLAAEAFVSLCTVIFCICSNGIYDFMGPIGAMFLRWLMFLTATGTSIHLAYQIRMIELTTLYELNDKESNQVDD